MALDGATLTISGNDVLAARLLAMTPIIRRKFAMKALKAGGKVVVKAAAAPGVAPVLSRAIYRKGVLIRKPGTMRDAIKVRSSRDVNRTGDVGVFVNVKPAKGSQRGAYSPDDPFYWRFVHFKTKTNRNPKPFLNVGAQQLEGNAFDAIKNTLGPDLQQLNLPGFVT